MADERSGSPSSPWLTAGLPLLAYCGLIFYLSSQSDLAVPAFVSRSDKIMHMLEYAGLGFLSGRFFACLWSEKPQVVLLLLAFFFTVVYGLSDEWHQAFVPGRDSSWLDLLADSVGGYVGARVYLWFWGRRGR